MHARRREGRRTKERRIGSHLVLYVLLMLLGASGDVGVLIGEDTYDAGGDFVVNDGLVVFAYDINAGFLLGLIKTK